MCASSLLLCVFVVMRAARGRSVLIPPAPFCFNLLPPGNWLRFTLHNTFIHLHILFLKYSALLHTRSVRSVSTVKGKCISFYYLFHFIFMLFLSCFLCFYICIFNSVTVVLSPLFCFPLRHCNTWFPRRGINKVLSYIHHLYSLICTKNAELSVISLSI